MDALREDAESASWTPQRVGVRLIEAFRLMPNTPVFSAGGVATAERRELQAAIDLIEATGRHLEPDARKKLLAWARARASDRSIAELCREAGWPRASFERTRAAALVALAVALGNERDVT